MTLGGFWPQDTPGPADMWKKALDELCDDGGCDITRTSTPVRIRARVPAPPAISGNFILRDLDLAIKIEQMQSPGQKGWKPYLQSVIAEYARECSYWSWDEYYEYDPEGQVKVGPVTHESYVSANDWFVTTPAGWELKVLAYTPLPNGDLFPNPDGSIQARIVAEFPDDGTNLLCGILGGVTPIVADFVPPLGGFITNLLGIGCK
ncbi:uncharacterized protein LOC62_05G007651 [Vanrija pseudolonga]|uniref:Uncharacterized protein n=1 Tax=Vanrija pseudolonga TaxID=143232 RepID=A0AAF0YCE2_9TREE|nr:hypothetical protein LOC62_05G007651 [Vanrija pseudolonga]